MAFLNSKLNSTKMIMYVNDGLGRDTFISYNNGGFLNDNYIKLNNKEKFPHPRFSTTFHSLKRLPAPFLYIRDGTGRDSYIAYNNGGLTKEEKKLKYNLRNYDNNNIKPNFNKLHLSQVEIKNNLMLKKIENGVIDRLYNNSKKKLNNYFNLKKNEKKKIFKRNKSCCIIYNNNIGNIYKTNNLYNKNNLNKSIQKYKILKRNKSLFYNKFNFSLNLDNKNNIETFNKCLKNNKINIECYNKK